MPRGTMRAVYIGATSAAVLEAVPDVDAGFLVRAVIAWALRDELPAEVPPHLALAWKLIEHESRMMHGQREEVADELHEKRADAGRKGGLATQSKAKQIKQTQANASKQAKQAIETETEKETEKSSASALEARAPACERVSESLAEEEAAWTAFWNAYPRRTNREQARRAWHDLFGTLPPKPETLAAILAAVQRGRASDQWREDGGRYIPSAEKWLRNRSWEVHDDALPPPAPRVRRANETNLTAIHSGNPQYANLPV